MDKAAVTIQSGTVIIAGHKLLTDVNLQMHSGEFWAITGPSGSGKTTLLNLIAGNIRPNSGSLQYHFDVKPTPSDHNAVVKKPVAFVALKHHFRDTSNTKSFYYQQRYNSSDAENSSTVADYLDGIKQTDDGHAFWTKERIVQKLHLNELMNRHLIKLSNGETRRLMIAAALLKNPSLLLLDAPFTGLDVSTRKELNLLLADISASGITIVVTTSAQQIPDAATHVAELASGQLLYAMSKADYELKPKPTVEKEQLNTEMIGQLYSSRYSGHHYNCLVDMQHVNISYNGVKVLNDINWQVKPGERWSLSGPNGAGKSTLLSLINGDNPQAYANHIVLFDRKRGSGESIWDIKKNIGFVSPELYQYFPSDQSCLQIIESGFYDTLGLFRISQAAKATEALQWMQALKIDSYARKLFRQIPAGAQRLCLLARALIKCPPLLILDEPGQGLDDEQQQNFKQAIDAICATAPVGVVYVTHYQHELPDCIEQHLQLNKGMVVRKDA